jgi:enhancing lycopene biosynthesis protein 2
MKTKMAVVLCGSGFKDGSEIRESVGVLWALSQNNIEAHCFAPDAPQFDVVNCLTGKTAPGEKRNMLVEAARIARGDIKPLDELKTTDFDGLVLPGGFGAAKNLCNYATHGTKAHVIPTLQSVIEKFFHEAKPIGAVCIAPMILALALKGHHLEITLGEESQAAENARTLGHKHFALPSNKYHVDQRNRIVTTPAYMNDDAKLHEIFDGINGMTKAMLELRAK